MTLKTSLSCFALSIAAFAVCCIVMLNFREFLTNEVAIYLFIGVWGISALAWPFFLMSTFIIGRRVAAKRRYRL